MKAFIISIIFCIAGIKSFAQNQNALVIGIDTYKPLGSIKPSASGRVDFRNLDGCRNDALAVKSLIQSFYAFKPQNVDTLFNRKATRASILAKFATLLNKSNAGDVAFIYYAGHGSQQRNSLTKEKDSLDESIVPADTYTAGVGDIRDKELAKIFNAFIDKGVKLTVILDCCHSGSMSRGLYDKPKSRYIATNYFDAKDDSNPQAPEDRKEGTFLIISAAQDDEPAEEAVDENKKPHGAFTISLLEAIKQQSVNASALNLFRSIGVILKSKGKSQEPVIGGDVERQNQTLFGIERGKLADKILIPVGSVDGTTVQLQGGFAEGLYKGHQLKGTNDTTLVLEVEKVDGIDQATAKLIKGSIKKVKVGQLFEISNWVSSGAPLLKVYVPQSVFTADQVDQLAKLSVKLKNTESVKYVDDFEKTDPDILAYFVDNKLYANIDRKALEEIKPDLKSLEKISANKSIFLNLPASKDLTDKLKQVFSVNKSIVIVNNANDANYILYGTVNAEGQPSYGLINAQASSKDSLASMPLQTRNYAVTDKTAENYDDVATNIYDLAKSLAKVKVWLTLASPVDDNNVFPFHLEFINNKTKEVVGTSAVKIGDVISLRLVADSNFATLPSVPQKYVYIFTIDKYGEMQLAYPNPRAGSVENKYPSDNTRTIYDMLTFKIKEPVGIDNFYVLASDTPIPGYAVLFNQKGTRGAGGKLPDPKLHPLINLLSLGNEDSIGATRGVGFETPSTWNLLKAPLKSSH
ncbi:DUF4384 domain-containing protein [Pedobacter changchengzhani]|uniref:DUF4384 domain-containing protein n=1 Tax=Pedobacter changchengzhani TaxID=2529274 RepID=A0A4R5MPN9_9SPHI|nr:caspase family protein [Pedobacter changchengzhani]TDG37820.1 DUF4384 domain-containing protein [Pedobacter changchengzhani]